MGACLEEAQPTLWGDVEAGDFSKILSWLRTHIHERGHMHDAPVLVKDAVGERDQVADLMAHLRGRLSQAYKN